MISFSVPKEEIIAINMEIFHANNIELNDSNIINKEGTRMEFSTEYIVLAKIVNSDFNRLSFKTYTKNKE